MIGWNGGIYYVTHSIGQFKETVVIEQNNPTQMGAGWVDVWSTLVTTKGFLRKLRGDRSLQSGEIFEDNAYELWIRYQPTLESNLSILKLRVIIGGKQFRIHSIEKIDQKNFYYRFLVSQHDL